MLTDAQIRTLWQQFNVPGWADWQKSYLGFIEKIRSTSHVELRTPALQRQLWKAKEVSSIGPGEAINLDDLYTNREFVEALSSLRSMSWPPEPEQRARAFHQEFEKLMAAIKALKERNRPNAKLQRIFAVFFPYDVSCLFNWSSVNHVSEFLLDGRRDSVIFLHVLIRARLKAVIGKEQDEAECVRRSTFCWWLHEKYTEIKAALPDLIGFQPPPPSPPPPPPPLMLWPFNKQFKGNTYLSDAVGNYIAVIQQAQAGLSMESLVEATRGELEYPSPVVRQLILRVLGLGFLEQRSELLYPTEAGTEILETDETDLFVERFLERIFGFAQLLRILRENLRGLDKDNVTAKLQELHPSWTSEQMPNNLRAWASALGLVERDEQKLWKLTEYGLDWEARLPQDLPSAPKNEEIKGPNKPLPVPNLPLQFPAFANLLTKFQEDPEVKTFVFSEEQLMTLHAAWHSNDKKHFIILSGLSGTGKTAVTRCYAKVVCELLKIDLQRHFALVAVSPDWNDPSGLLGYLNALHADPTFQAEPALRILLRAVQDPANPYFLVLDEMNLARVERYFAPFLSAMESGEALSLHTQEEPINGVPPRIAWPRNLFIAGTVNMDESTHSFSDKVLDRAFTLEFWEVDLPGYFARRPEPRLLEAESVLIELNKLLYPLRRHFGYRTANEILSFLSVGRSLGAPSAAIPATLYDQAIFSKVLPRLRGEDSPVLREALQKLEELCKTRGFTACEKKLSSMRTLLHSTGVTRFWS